jgi:hypothetical protein
MARWQAALALAKGRRARHQARAASPLGSWPLPAGPPTSPRTAGRAGVPGPRGKKKAARVDRRWLRVWIWGRSQRG